MGGQGYSGFHDDRIYMKGSERLLTAWVPLMPIDFGLGGLIVVEGSCSAGGKPRLHTSRVAS